MNVRALQKIDILELRELHDKYYKDEFRFPEFDKHFLNAFVIEDDNRIITAGGVRVIPEIITLTDKEAHARKRKEAFEELLRMSIFTIDNCGFRQIHAFVDPSNNWAKLMMKYGFKPIEGTGLVLSI
jgi:hypothetical protein